MIRAVVMLALLIGSMAPGSARAQADAAINTDVVLRVELASGQREFHLGEAIPLTLTFSSTVKDRYQLNTAQYDRSGRMEYEHFSVSPGDGAVDPLAGRKSPIGGGLTGYQFLGSKPWTLQLNVNEWVRFTRPGEYRLTTTSRRISVKDPTSVIGASAITVRGNDVVLRIVPANAAWQKSVLNRADATLAERPPTNPAEIDAYVRSRRTALEALRFLGTRDAIRELAKRMPEEELGGLEWVCLLGLVGAPDRAFARAALEDSLRDPDHAINGNFLYALRTLNSPPGEVEDWREIQRKVVEQLISTLSTKRGKALSVSLGTAVNEAWNGAPLPSATVEKLVQQFVARFDQLPLAEQNMLLTYRWDKVAGPAMLPILRRYAQNYKEGGNPQDPEGYQSRQLSASALQHWYELDPAGARPAIIREISKAQPRYDARVLGILPDKTLPEVEGLLAEHFVVSDDLVTSSRLASLIARYGSDAILPQVVGKIDPQIGKWACDIQSPALAYVLRVSPALARPRIEKALAAREFTGCSHTLFQTISEIHYDPVLEEIGVAALDDADPQVAMTAATMLGRFGSAAVEETLWQHYLSWSARWQGREAELDLTFAEMHGDRVHELGLGENLLSALASGRSWLADEGRLRQLAQITRVRRLHQQLDGYLKIWAKQPLTITVVHNGGLSSFEARVAQYQPRTMEEVEEKVGQFPRGTKFYVATSATPSPADRESVARLREFLNRHGFVVAGETVAQ
ncbi:MAG: hypothetical protein M3P27_02425 [Acidobacteriota bacterium]|nr:hypothetical protein [Acidobacteriota bacterium]